MSSGFSRKSNAPRWVASTAVAMVPWPEIMTIWARASRSRSRLKRLEPVEPRHLHVEEDEVRAELRVDADRLSAGRGDANVQVLVLEDLLERLANARLVVDDENPVTHDRGAP